MQHPNPLKLYNASAGSGKTFTLVREFLILLLGNPDSHAFSQLLAITFTNKAANEMKSRIVDKLKELSEAPKEHKEILEYAEITGLEPDVVKGRAKSVLSAILHNYGLFSVSTIDKFNLRLMRAFSQDLGLAINFDVEMDTAQMLSESVDLMFAELHENSLLSDILSDIALKNLATDKKWDITSEIVEQSAELLNDKFLNEMQQFQELSLDDFNRFRKEVYQHYFGAKQNMEELAGNMLAIFEEHGLNDADFHGKSRGLIGFFRKIELGTFGSPNNTQLNLIAEEKYFKSTQPDELISSVTSAVNQILQELSTYAFWGKIFKQLNSLTVINEIEKRLNQIKSENNILLISEFNKIIGNSIKDQPVPFIYEKIGSRYRHYFIDEFQDTSDLQWANLEPLLLNALSEDQTAMLVGDPKQSIYRWRGGNPDLMISLPEQMKGRVSVEKLPKNWRSHQAVVNFNNDLYRFISGFINRESYRILYEEAGQEANHRPGGYVQLRILEKPKQGSGESFFDHCADKLLEDIQLSKANGFRNSEMAILTRTRNESRRIAEFLTDCGINVISGESLLLMNSDQVLLMIEFIRFLANPGIPEQRMNLLLWLHHNRIIETDDLTSLIRENINSDEAEFTLFLKGLGIPLDLAFLPFQSFYEQVSAALRAFGIDRNANAYISFFMDEILKFQYQPDPTPQNFLELWEVKKEKLSITVPEGQDAIQLMTIHRSKGLEFKVVFIPYVTWNPKNSGIWIPVEDNHIQQFYIDDFKDPDLLPEAVRELMDLETFQSEMDSLNELYVATTRAVEQLYITAPKQNPDTRPVAVYLNQFTEHTDPECDGVLKFGHPERVSEIKNKVKNQQVVPFVSTDWRDRVQISKEHALLWDSSRAEAVDYGNKMHAVLERTGNISETAEVLDTFEQNGFISSDERKNIESELAELFRHEKLQEVFASETFFNERDFLTSEGSIFRPDRLAKTKDGWVLIDYKTGEYRDSYKKQIQFYADGLKLAGFDIQRKYLVFLGSHSEVMEI